MNTSYNANLCQILGGRLSATNFTCDEQLSLIDIILPQRGQHRRTVPESPDFCVLGVGVYFFSLLYTAKGFIFMVKSNLHGQLYSCSTCCWRGNRRPSIFAPTNTERSVCYTLATVVQSPLGTLAPTTRLPHRLSGQVSTAASSRLATLGPDVKQPASPELVLVVDDVAVFVLSELCFKCCWSTTFTSLEVRPCCVRVLH